GKAEALIERRIDEERREAIKKPELVIGGQAGEAHPVGDPQPLEERAFMGLPVASSDDEAVVLFGGARRRRLPATREGFMVKPTPDVEPVRPFDNKLRLERFRFPGSRGPGKKPMVDAMVHDRHLLGSYPEEPAQIGPGLRGDRDEMGRLADAGFLALAEPPV